MLFILVELWNYYWPI